MSEYHSLWSALSMHNWAEDLEKKLSGWADPLSTSENDACERALRMISDALKGSKYLQGIDYEVFVQGSFKNRTNIPGDSDVDVCVRCKNTIFYNAPSYISKSQLGLSEPDITYDEFRRNVYLALCDKFGPNEVIWDDKAFKIKGNSSRVSADVLAAFTFKKYDDNFPLTTTPLTGSQFVSKSGNAIINWPEHHYRNGIAKNKATNFRFKDLTRILKNAKSELVAQGSSVAKKIPPFFIECLVWNVPNERFIGDSYTADLKRVLLYLYAQTSTDVTCSGWFEVNGIKSLFGNGQKVTRADVRAFVEEVWNLLGLKDAQ